MPHTYFILGGETHPNPAETDTPFVPTNIPLVLIITGLPSAVIPTGGLWRQVLYRAMKARGSTCSTSKFQVFFKNPSNLHFKQLDQNHPHSVLVKFKTTSHSQSYKGCRNGTNFAFLEAQANIYLIFYSCRISLGSISCPKGRRVSLPKARISIKNKYKLRQGVYFYIL